MNRKTAPPPGPREFTLTEDDTLKFQQQLKWGLLAVIAATFALSFTALSWLGLAMGLPYGIHFIVPLFADGGQLIAAAAITTRKTEGRHAFPEWLGLGITLGLSVIANVYHSIELGDPGLVMWVKVAFATAIPVCVALYIHIYERSLTSKLRSHILVGDRNHLRFDVAQLDDLDAQQTAQSAPRKSAPAPRTAPVAPRTPTAHEAVDEARSTAQRAPGGARSSDDGSEQVAQLVRAHVAVHGTASKPVAAAIHRDLGFTHNMSTTRRWVKDAYDATVQSIEGTAHDDEPVEQDRALSTAS